ncbi:MAG: hypothetical protein N3D11_16600 [Candidatus Sumerlaeia bacterium]|nr:hypothetical protein [Candidatus Sumerlaeia bacterium]
MIDPILERRYSDCRELLNLWRRFHDFFKMGVQGEGITPEKEHEFITVKSRIAMLHDTFMSVLDHDQNVGQNILTIVTRSITLKHLRRMSTAEIKKIELEWHESYLLLNEVIGLLEDKRRQFATVTPAQYYRQVYTKKTKEALIQFFTGWVFKTIAILLALVIGGFFFLQYGGLEYLLRTPATRSFVIKLEDVIRLAYGEYPYRDLVSVTRMDANLSKQIIEEARDNAHNEPGNGPNEGIKKIAQKMAGSPDDVSKDLAPIAKGQPGTDFRTDAFRTNFMVGGASPPVVYMYRLPSKAAAMAIEAKYRSWRSKQPANYVEDWHLFRRANMIGVIFGGDDRGQARTYLLGQYTRVRTPVPSAP